jgi:hypothetical protein
MRKMRRVIPFVVIFLCLAQAGIAAAEQINDWRCGNALVSLGDSKFKVQNSCGKPYAMEDTGGGQSADPNYTEKWTYNMGPRDYVYQLSFTAGNLVEINRMGRGF